MSSSDAAEHKTRTFKNITLQYIFDVRVFRTSINSTSFITLTYVSAELYGSNVAVFSTRISTRLRD